MKPITQDNSMLGYSVLAPYPNIFHFTTTRVGGSGKGTYDSFNCSPFCGDDPSVVAMNQSRLLEVLDLPTERLIIPRQVHSARIEMIDQSFLDMDKELQSLQLDGVDALITDVPCCCVAVSTADCVPILLYDTKKQVVAAIHAGWRGTVQHIAALTIQVMADNYGSVSQNIIATIGPSISKESFEVGDEVYDAFVTAGFEVDKIASRHLLTHKYHIDLWKANKLQLVNAGVPATQIEVSGLCTWTNHQQFFSARRLGIASGRILSGIMLK